MQAQLDDMMPPGAPPILLFRTFVKNLPMARAMRGWGGYELGRELSLTLRDREIVIDRTCWRCGAEYEWGVHIAFFGARAELTPDEVRALTSETADAFAPRERLLISLCDQLHATSSIDDDLWAKLAAEWSPAQLVELVVLAGFYHTISFAVNAFALAPEPFAARWSQGSNL